MSSFLPYSETNFELKTYLQYLTAINDAKEYCSHGNLITATQYEEEITLTCACDEIVRFNLDKQYDIIDILTYFHNEHAITHNSYMSNDGIFISKSTSNLHLLKNLPDKKLHYKPFISMPLESIGKFDNFQYFQPKNVKKLKMYFKPNLIRNKKNIY